MTVHRRMHIARIWAWIFLAELLDQGVVEKVADDFFQPEVPYFSFANVLSSDELPEESETTSDAKVSPKTLFLFYCEPLDKNFAPNGRRALR